MDVVKKLVEIRKKNKIKTKDICKQTGFSRTTLFRIENNKVESSFESVVKYANCLGFDLVLVFKEK